MTKRILSFIILTLAFSAISLSAGTVKLSLDYGRGKRGIEVGDMFYIYIQVSNMDGKPEIPKNIPGAKILYFDHTGSSSQMSSVNGVVTQSVSNTWTVTLKAQKEGDYSFGPVSVGSTKSNQLKYSIGKAQPQQSAPGMQTANNASNRADQSQDDPSKPKFIGKGDGNLFMKASVSHTSVYEQQAVVYTVKLYTTYDAVKFIGATASPKFEGFVVEESKAVSSQLNYETVNGKTYASAVIARYIIFPQMTGKLKVLGNTYTISVDQREYYHDPFWGTMSVGTPLQLNVSPNDLTIDVKPLPSPKPADFSGGVGQFNISSQLKSKDFKTNQAAQILYVVTGTGNLKYVQLPDLATIYPQELEVYTPTIEVKDNVGSSNVSGQASFDYSFMPLEEGTFTIPKVSLVYFNPETGKYETSVSKQYEITVGKGKSSDKSQTKSRLKFDPTLEKVNMNSLKKEHIPYVHRSGYWILFFLPMIILLMSIGGYRYYTNTHADMAAFNSRHANRLASRRLRKAAANMKRGNISGFYDELLIALWGYLGDKLKMPTSELMRDNIRNVLDSKGISQSATENFVGLIDRCEYVKYSPDSGKEEMDNVYQSAIDVINNLEKSFKEIKK